MAITKELRDAYTRIFFVELAYWFVSIGMVFINEFILNADVLTEDLTVFITLFQIMLSLSILMTLNYITQKSSPPVPSSNLVVKLGDQSPISITTKLLDTDEPIDNNHPDCDSNESGKGSSDETQYSKFDSDSSESLAHLFRVSLPRRVNLETCRLVLPLSILYVGMILLNNFCLKYVGVAFYFVSRSLTTVFNVIFVYFIMNETVSFRALICCAFIVLGFILGIDQESVFGSLSVIGVVFGIASSLFGSLYSIYTKKTLAKLEKNIWTVIMYNNINAIMLCIPLTIIHGDVKALMSERVLNSLFWLLLSLSGIMSFFISIVTNASIKYTSPLTHNVSGTAKACFQTVIAVIYLQDHKSTLWWISNFIILIASAAYSRIKQLEMEKARLSKGLCETISGSPLELCDRRSSESSTNSEKSSLLVTDNC